MSGQIEIDKNANTTYISDDLGRNLPVIFTAAATDGDFIADLGDCLPGVYFLRLRSTVSNELISRRFVIGN